MSELITFLTVMMLEIMDGCAICNGFALKFTIPMFIILWFSAHAFGYGLSETIRLHPEEFKIKPIKINVNISFNIPSYKSLLEKIYTLGTEKETLC